MADPLLWTLGSVALVSILSLVGAVTLLFPAVRTHAVILFLVAIAAGTLVGDTFLHILPEAAGEAGGFTTGLGLLMVSGFVLMFVLEVVLRWQHSHAIAVDDPHPHPHHAEIQPFGWMNLVSDATHNLIDGVVIAAAYVADVGLGIATTIAVAAHEIPQELGDFAVLLRAGMKPVKALLFNLGSAVFALMGAVAVLWLPFDAATVSAHALPLIGGAFLYIAASDLIPELHMHARGRETAWILFAFILGIALMYFVGGLEALTFGDEHGHVHA